MGKINNGRVILGGLVAGLVINVGEFLLNAVILAKRWESAMQALNKKMEEAAIPYFILGGFFLGVAAVWVYAAMRTRFGPGPGTAICAGLVAWGLAYLYPTIGFMALRIFPTDLLLIGTFWGLVELPIATLVGGWLYKEEAPA
jgi:hypothetical protein